MLPVLIGVVAVLVIGAIIVGRPWRFYFVRHGQTLSNAQHIRQGKEGMLSEAGRHQAEMVGQYLKNFPIKRILTSDYPRAEETAMIVNTFLKVPVIASPLLGERRNPSEIIGKSTKDPEVIRIVDQMDLAYHTDDFRVSDEENFDDLMVRARACVKFLIFKGARETAVITHHLFLKVIVAYFLYHDRLHAADFVKLTFFNTSDNAGITVCEFHPWKIFSKTRGWEVVSFNEQPEI
ncbi:MAG: histidine phosphatase family protein [Minisyncoccota bacterium]